MSPTRFWAESNISLQLTLGKRLSSNSPRALSHGPLQRPASGGAPVAAPKAAELNR